MNRQRERPRRITVAATLSAAAALGATLLMAAAPAHADTTLDQHVYNTGGQGVYLHPDSPALASATSELMPDGTEFVISCYTASDTVLGDAIWDYGTDPATGATGYAADYYIDTPVTQGNEGTQLSQLGLPECGTTDTTTTTDQSTSGVATTGNVSYDRDAAVQFALANVNTPPSFDGDDCTWYVSQALWVGGLPQSDQWTGDSWNWDLVASNYHYPGPTVTAAQANSLVNYLVSNGMATRIPIDWSDNSASGAQPGDIIAYHWNNGEDADQVDHLAFVTDLNSDGYPDVSQHSPAVTRYWSFDPGGTDRSAGWIQDIDRPDGHDPSAWLIHINDGSTF